MGISEINAFSVVSVMIACDFSLYQTQPLIDKGIAELAQRYLDNSPSEQSSHEYNATRKRHLCDFSQRKYEQSRELVDTLVDPSAADPSTHRWSEERVIN